MDLLKKKRKKKKNVSYNKILITKHNGEYSLVSSMRHNKSLV